MRWKWKLRELDKKNNSIKNSRRDTFLVCSFISLSINLLMLLIQIIVTQFLVKKRKSIKVPEHFEAIEGTHKDSSSYVITRNQETPPLVMGPQRLHYVYATTLPQTYLTLLSVLQGLVFSVLLLNIPLPPNASLLSIYAFLLQQYLYLPYIISSLVILIVWNQFVHGILFLAWPFTVFQSSLMFLMSLVEILTFRSANFFSAWLFGLGWITIVGALTRFNNLRYLPNEKQNRIAAVNNYAAFSKKRELEDGILYMSLGIILIVFSLSFHSLIVFAKEYQDLVTKIITWFSLVLLLTLVITILTIDKVNRRKYLNIFIENSDLAASSHGIISYKKTISRES